MINELLEAIKYNLQQEIKDLRQVEIQGSGFNGVSDVKTFASYAPCARIGINSVVHEQVNSGQLDCKLNISIFLITVDKDRNTNRYQLGYKFLEDTLELVNKGKWLKANQDKEYIKVMATEQGSINTKIYHGESSFKTGVGLFEVSWNQVVRLGQDIFEGK